MTPEQQRITIAKACGWSVEKTDHFKILYPPGVKHCGLCCGLQLPDDEVWEVGLIGDGSNDCLCIPDYPNDLNACHEMEKVAFFTNGTPASRWQSYDNELHRICDGFGRAHATAAQRCEAFLRTLNLWQE